MPRFAANLSMLFTEVPFLDRFEAAAAAGFAAVEFQFPYAWPAAEIRARLDRHGLQAVLHNLPAGDWAAGERGIACLPDRVDEFRTGVAQAIEYATTLGVRQLNCLAGMAPVGADPAQLHATLVGNLRYAAAELRRFGLRLLVEPVNTRDVPGFFLHSSAQAIQCLDEAGADSAFLQYDLYHAQRMEGELAATLTRWRERIGHIQIADNPGRHEPGSGEIAFDFLFAHLDRLGYDGWVGCEYVPAGTTVAGLGWLARAARASNTPTKRAGVGADGLRPAHTAAPSELLRASFKAALAAADPARMLAAHLPPAPRGRVCVVGAGKAAASMARAVERAWPQLALDGLVVTRYGHGLPTERIRVVEAGHPVPDAAGQAAAAEILALASGLTADDLLLVLLSGGGSSLLALPADGVSMADLQALTHALLRSGAPIAEINRVRKQLSRIAGGQLAAATRAQVLALIVSDVVGDAPSDIASGPCAPDRSTCADAQAVLARWACPVPASVAAHLARGVGGPVVETPALEAQWRARVQNRVIANAHASLEAAAELFGQAGIHPVLLGDSVTGEAREVARAHAAIVREVRGHGQPFAAPVALISGGECTVTLPPHARGRGGRCTEYLLSLAVELAGVAGVHALAADTDGIDGSQDNAGAWFGPQTLAEHPLGWAGARAALDAHDAWGFFAAVDTLIVTGPTRTNVNDYRVILVT